MPVRDIRTRLSIEGEKELKRELAAAAREMRVLESGMKAAAAGALAADDDMGRLESASKGLRAQLAQQEEIARALAQALRDSADAFGDNSKETDEWKIKLNNALTKQEQLRKAIMDTDREMDELARDSVRAGRQLENGLGDSAEDTARSLRDMYDEMKGDISAIRGSVGFSALTDAWEFGSGIVTGLDSFAEGTRDYRRQMAFIRQNAEMAGLDFQAIKDQYFEMAALTGDEDGAFEGLNNLIASGLDMTEIISVIDELGGAVIRFPETLKFESLADGLQETIATRHAAGQYGELLERLGVNIDDFNKALAAAKTEEEAQQVTLSFLANHGMKELNGAFVTMNPELVRASDATNKLNDAMSRFGGIVDEVIAPAKLTLADVLNTVADIAENPEGTILKPGWVKEKLREEVDEILPGFREELAKTEGEGVALEFLKDLLTGTEKAEAKTLGTEYAEAVQQGIVEALEEEKTSGLGDWLAAGAEWIDQLFGWNDTSSATEKAADAASEVTAAVRDQISADSPALQSTAFSAGELMMAQMGAGITAGAAIMLSQLQNAMMSAANMVSMPIGSSGNVPVPDLSGGIRMGEAVINLDGKQVGNALLPYVNQGMGTALRTNEIY